MRARILRYQLIALFVLTVASLVCFYYKESLPDNIFSISSNGTSNFLSYHLTSALTLVGFYVGPWVFFGFMLFTILYVSVFIKREHFGDLISSFFILSSIAGIIFFAFPILLGDGLRYYLNSISSLYVGLATASCFVMALVIVFRSKLKEHLVQSMYRLKIAGQNIFHFVGSSRNLDLNGFRSQLSVFTVLRERLSMPISGLLKGKRRIIKPKMLVEENGQIQTVGLETTDLEIEAVTTGTEPISLQELSEEVVTVENFKPLKSPNAKPLVKSKDLIACLTSKKGKQNISPEKAYFEDTILRLEEKFAEFNIDVRIVNIMKGPVVDTFELELGPGVKVSKATSIQNDLSLTLCGIPIRMVYPMPGKNTIGIEVPRNPREIIYLDEVLNSKTFAESNRRLPIVMGKNAYGQVSIADLTKMPHMLVAGSTGSGKSVFINTLLVSLLVKMSPANMKLILIDPKQLELALYAKLPHLMMPVITDAKIAALSLMWAVEEMERRYCILKEMRVRNIEGFNVKVAAAPTEELMKIHSYYEDQEGQGYELPYLVIIIDEFADLMLTKSGKEIEGNVCRLAAKARAAGIHLIVATQRPSVDVITGLIKSNFPTRVSFKVASAVDSRTILNSNGGEKLLGNGDMLYKHGVDMTREHSAFIDEIEIEALVEKIGEVEPEFSPAVLDFIENQGQSSEAGGSDLFGDGRDSATDAYYNEAVDIIIEHSQASASFLQRRLKIGYNRAANLIDNLEAKGVIGPAQGSKPREVLIGR